MQKWEYKIVGNVNELELNRLGEQGWELVSVTFTDSAYVGNYYFKRPKSS